MPDVIEMSRLEEKDVAIAFFETPAVIEYLLVWIAVERGGCTAIIHQDHVSWPGALERLIDAEERNSFGGTDPGANGNQMALIGNGREGLPVESAERTRCNWSRLR